MGPPGQVVVNADLSIPNGWHSTVKLAAARPIAGGGDPVVVRLDLDALAARATAGAKATGTSADDVSVAVVPRVTSGAGAPFAPALNLQLTPLALNLRTAGSALTVQDAESAPTKVSVPQVFHFAGRDLVTVSTARTVTAAMLLAAILAALAFLLAIRRSPPVPEDERIRRRHGPLLVEVQPMVAAIDRPTVHVTEFETLARLALRYGLLVLHWPDGNGTTYTVHDDAADYRYSTAAAAGSADNPIAAAGPADNPTAAAGPVADPTAAPELAGKDEPAAADDDAEEVEQPPHWEAGLALAGARDELTSLATRSLFEDEVQYTIDNGNGTARLCLILIDVDDLGSINEEYGRAAGDAVLVGIAERLRRTVRPRDLVARLEGDDFAVLIEDVASSAVDAIAKRVMRVVHQSLPVGNLLMQVRVSIGVVKAAPSQNAAELMEHGRAALVEAKNTYDMHYAWLTEDHVPEPG